MNVALKEWASVITAIEAGKQILLVRKGGIVEADRGGFRPRYREFLFFPTFEHQHNRFLKSEYATAAPADPTHIEISLSGRVTDVLQAPASPELLCAASMLYIWNDEFVRARYRYRPDLPLSILLVRAGRLAKPVRIPNRQSYAGCKSWVHLTEEVDPESVSVLNDDLYDAERAKVFSYLGDRVTTCNVQE